MSLWRARDVMVLVSTSSTAASAADFTSATDYAGVFKSIEFKEPERSTGEQKLLGATSGAANSEVWEEDPSVSELSGEILMTPKNGETVDVNELFYTYTGSDPKEFNYASDPSNPSFLIAFGISSASEVTSGNFVGFVLTGVKLNTLGGVKVESDGHASAEIKVTAAANKTKKIKAGTYAV